MQLAGGLLLLPLPRARGHHHHVGGRPTLQLPPPLQVGMNLLILNIGCGTVMRELVYRPDP